MESVAAQIRLVSQSASESARAACTALRRLEEPALRIAGALNFRRTPADDGGSAQWQSVAREIEVDCVTSRRLLASIVESGESLVSEIMSLKTGITADQFIGQASEECLRKLDEAARMVGGARQRENWLRAGVLYTMRAERDVHATFLAAGSRPGPTQSTALESEFGANVELF